MSPPWCDEPCRSLPAALARYALLGLGAPRLRLVLRIERPGYPDLALRLVPHLLIGEVSEDRRDEQEDRNREARRVPALEVRLGGPHQEGGDVRGHLVDR